MGSARFCAQAQNMRPCRAPVPRCMGCLPCGRRPCRRRLSSGSKAGRRRRRRRCPGGPTGSGLWRGERVKSARAVLRGRRAWTAEAAVATWAVVDEEFLIVDFWLLIDNWDAPLGVQSAIESRQSTIGFTGPSTNGRSSAFGALCLGSNPSGPARQTSSQLPVLSRDTGAPRLRTENRELRTEPMATVATTTAEKTTAEKTVAEKKPTTDEKTERKPQRARVDDRFKVFCGTANEALCDEVCHFLGLTRGQALVTRFKDGEAYVQIQENVRGADVFVMQPTCQPVDMHLMELLLMMDALKRASARRITAVIPYYGYARQDRKDKPRVPISSKLVADLLTTAGADRALVVDLHAPQLQGFFNIPVDHLFASPVLVDYFKKLHLPNLTVVSPDAGGVERARFFAKKVDAALAIVDKHRGEMNVAEVMHVISEVNGRTCLLIDDLIDTAGTLVKTASALVENGATTVYACASHAVLSGPAVENIRNSVIKEVVVTNTIPLTAEADAARTEKGGKISVLSIAGLIGRAIQANHEETSVSKLFT